MSSVEPTENHAAPRIVPRPDHTISRAGISPNAVKVLYRLKNAGYAAYLVGGGVRDLLLGREPKDFDIATDALPDEVRAQFRNCRLVGRRFRLALVHFGREIVEVATFRAITAPDTGGEGEDVDTDTDTDTEDDFSLDEAGRIVRDNVYGTLEEDAWRRDFTVNALYYNIADFSVVDYTGGMEDLREGILRLIGDPDRRYREDPVRMLRAVRFATKLGFRIHPESEGPLLELGSLLEDIPPARLFEEVQKLFFGGYGLQTFELLRHYGLFRYLFPQTEASLSREEDHFPRTLLTHALDNTDERVRAGKPVTPAFLLAALLWDPVHQAAVALMEDGENEIAALQQAADAVVAQQITRVAIPKRIALPMREIWYLQPRLTRTSGNRPMRLLTHPRFRAAYDFLLLRAAANPELAELAEWWTRFQETDEEQRPGLVTPGGNDKRRRRRRRRPRKPDAQ